MQHPTCGRFMGCVGMDWWGCSGCDGFGRAGCGRRDGGDNDFALIDIFEVRL